jgi:hypothetical protein
MYAPRDHRVAGKQEARMSEIIHGTVSGVTPPSVKAGAVG